MTFNIKVINNSNNMRFKVINNLTKKEYLFYRPREVISFIERDKNILFHVETNELGYSLWQNKNGNFIQLPFVLNSHFGIFEGLRELLKIENILTNRHNANKDYDEFDDYIIYYF
jgi:hypothetical protein